MTRFLRYALIPLLTAGLLVGATDCVTNCKNGVCTDTTATQFVGSLVTQHVPWAAGQGITIAVPGGNLRSGPTATSITVSPGSGADIQVTFTPFVSDTAANEASARMSMNDPTHGGNLILTSNGGSGSSPASIGVSFTGTHQSSLSATVDIILPAGFDGAINATTDSGDVSVAGTQHGVNVASNGPGNIEVDLGTVLPTDTGVITTDLGDITLKVPTAASLDIQAQATSTLTTTPNPISSAAGWMEVPGGTDQVGTFRGNGGTQSTPWQLKTNLGAIQIDVQ